VHARPEQALENTLRRFEELGRGAGIGVMASIQGELPDSLQLVRERFRDEVALQIVDRRPFHDPKVLDGWQHLGVLRSEGTYEHIKHRLTAALEQLRSTGRLDDDAYGQALSLAPRSAHAGLDSSARERDENPGHERSRAPENRQKTLLTPPPPAMTTAERERESRQKWLAMRAEQMATEPGTLEERQARSREQWLEYRRSHGSEQNSELEKDQGQEKDAEQAGDLGHEHDGRDIDFD
jgi:hypothetical protein